MNTPVSSPSLQTPVISQSSVADASSRRSSETELVIKNTNQNNKENPYPSSFSDGFGSLGYWGTTDY